MTDPNMHDSQEQPEYGAYDRNRDEAQTPRYFDNPYGNPYMAGGNQGQDGSWQPVSPFKLVEEWLPQQAKNAIRGVYGVLGVVALILGLALLIWPGATLKVAAIALGAYFVVSGVIRIVTAVVELGLPGGWRVLDILIGVLLTVGGVIVLKNAALSGATLAVLITMVVGLGWMMEGVMALVEILAYAKLRMGRGLCAVVDRGRFHRAVLPGEFHRMAHPLRRLRPDRAWRRRHRPCFHLRQAPSQVTSPL